MDYPEMTIEHLRKYYATVKIRRGLGWDVRPDTPYQDGERLLFVATGIMEKSGRPEYAGEWLMMPDDYSLGRNWIASGDLTDFNLCPWRPLKTPPPQARTPRRPP